MPMIWIPQEEFEALQAALTRYTDQPVKVDWQAFDRAVDFLRKPVESQTPDAEMRIQFAEETESD
jgi:hypothetical protein